jgi:hypothetical protein
MKKAILVIMFLFVPFMMFGQTVHSATLAWTQGAGCATGTVCPVTGFNIYRTQTAGVNEVVIGSTTGATTYTDLAVTAGSTYFYKITALCATCTTVESGRSAPVTAVIPADVIPAQPLPPSGVTVTTK